METNKEKAIREAYGEYWEQMKPFIGSHGWFDKNSFYNKKFSFGLYKNIDLFFIHKGDYMMPKSLQGIENNNGWIAINSEDDLPKNSCSCWIDVNGHVSNTPFWYNYGTTQFSFNDIIYNFSNVKAYQIAIQPLKRIY